jgi:hypothetical protein
MVWSASFNLGMSSCPSRSGDGRRMGGGRRSGDGRRMGGGRRSGDGRSQSDGNRSRGGSHLRRLVPLDLLLTDLMKTVLSLLQLLRY